jgi:H+/gluconate symporter-like permease
VMVLLVLLLLAVAARRFFEWRPRLRAAVALPIAAGAFAAVFTLIPHDGRIQLIIAVWVALTVYAVSVVALGVLSRGDLATLWSGLGSRRRVTSQA